MVDKHKKWYQNPYGWYIGVLVVLNVLPFVAPVLMKLSETPGLGWLKAPAKGIYLFYSFTCHQFEHRSLHIADYQCAWCARDVGIWGGILAGALAARGHNVKALKWYWAALFVIPIALDGGIQTVATVKEVGPGGEVKEPVYVSNNFVRFITGAIFGLGLSLLISPSLRGTLVTEVGGKLKERKDRAINSIGAVWGRLSASTPKLVMSMVALFVVLYLGIVQVWNVTSTVNKPSDFLDSAVKTPTGDFFVRRGHGPCATNSKDLFRFDCLLGREE